MDEPEASPNWEKIVTCEKANSIFTSWNKTSQLGMYLLRFLCYWDIIFEKSTNDNVIFSQSKRPIFKMNCLYSNCYLSIQKLWNFTLYRHFCPCGSVSPGFVPQSSLSQSFICCTIFAWTVAQSIETILKNLNWYFFYILWVFLNVWKMCWDMKNSRSFTLDSNIF